MKTKIVVASHKEAWMPEDPVYLPVQAGRAAAETPLPGFTGDDSGENISSRNPHYCELTALYWAWKNLDADCLGLVHYRRHFAGKRFGALRTRIISGTALEKKLSRAPLLLPTPRHYFIETNRSQYVHAHHEADLETTRAVIAETFPEYLAAFDRVMRRTWGHRFNMFVMRREILDRYCRWLFAILFAVEKRLDISHYDPYNARVFGFLGERLLDVWLEHEKVPFLEVPTLHLESQHWGRKIRNFLRRKFFPQYRPR